MYHRVAAENRLWQILSKTIDGPIEEGHTRGVQPPEQAQPPEQEKIPANAWQQERAVVPVLNGDSTSIER
jgi:hypothetical protein